MGIPPLTHQPATAEDFAPAVPANTLICRACSYTNDGIPLVPVLYPCPPANEPAEAAARLAAAVAARRTQLGLSRKRLAKVSGISERTIVSVEEAHPANWRDATTNGLEMGLRWRRGSINALLKGRNPTPLLAAPEDTPPEEYVILQSGLPSDLEETLIDHMRARRQDMTAALEVEARLLIDQMRAVASPRNPHDTSQTD